MCTEKSIEELILNTKELDFAKSYHEKQMKIVKAVNYLKGIQASTNTSFSTVFYDGFNCEFCFVRRLTTDTVCTIEEYNQCIEEMKYHYDIPKWCSYNRADKEPLTVENSDYSFYEKEKFFYGQDVYVNNKPSDNGKLKFGFYHINGDSAILFNDLHLAYSVELSAISSKPFKYKEDIEIEVKEDQVIDMIGLYYDAYYAGDIKSFFKLMQENGHLSEIILPLEES